MNFKRKINKPYVPARVLGIRQEGGEVMMGEPDMGAPMEGGDDPVEEILMMAQQAVEAQDGAMALQVCAALVEVAMGGAPAEAPMEEEPMMEEDMEEPME